MKSFYDTEQKIIEKVPSYSINWLTIIMLLLFAPVLMGIVIVKFPDVVEGTITLVTNQQPINLFLPKEGEIAFCKKDNENVHSGDIVARVVGNTPFESVLSLRDTLLKIEMSSSLYDSFFLLDCQPYLGELNVEYSNFLETLRLYKELEKDTLFIFNINQLKNKIKENERLLIFNEEEKKILESKINIAYNSFMTDSMLYINGSILLQTYQSSLINYYNCLENFIQISSQNESLNSSIKELYLKIEILRKEKQIQKDEAKLKLLTQFNNLLYSIEQWLLDNTVIAPINGTLEISKFVEDSHFIRTNVEIARVLPTQAELRGLIYFSSKGAGKVDNNSTIKIYPDDYSKFEDGYLIGKLTNVSSSAYTDQYGKSYYQADVIIDSKDQQYFATELNYRHNMTGTVEIIVEKKRLIFQIFSWLERLSS